MIGQAHRYVANSGVLCFIIMPEIDSFIIQLLSNEFESISPYLLYSFLLNPQFIVDLIYSTYIENVGTGKINNLQDIQTCA